jgi:aryl-alcohol dehydrogenase-like predicted oxidoreductase
MQYKFVEKIGKNWSAITFGCWQIAPSDGWGDLCAPEMATKTIKAALDAGITAFDTAEGYGDHESERRLGKALGTQRDEVIVISKIWPDAALSHSAYKKRLDQTLLSLNRDYVDLYLIHFPSDEIRENSEQFCEIMLALKDSGKARSIGLSNFELADLKGLGTYIKEFIIHQVPYSLLDQSYGGETQNFCEQTKLPYMAYSPTAKGLLARLLTEGERLYPARNKDDLFAPKVYPEAVKVFKVVEKIAHELNVPPVQVALAWVNAQSNVLTAILGSRRPQQIEEAAGAGDLQLSQEHLSELRSASKAFVKHSQKQ